jgi:hypothetical protein
MNQPTPTPRTDAAWAASFSPERANFSVRDECEKLELELVAAKAECDLNRTRLASIFWSGAMDKFTGGDVQKWAADYTAELTRLRDEVERFTGYGLLDCHAICDQRDTAVAERDQLRAEAEALKQSLESGQRVLREDAERNAARAEKAEADTARLDWLGKSSYAKFHEGPCVWRINGDEKTNGDTLREAIDAAMKGTI